MKNLYFLLIFFIGVKTFAQGPVAYYNFNNTLAPTANVNAQTTFVNSGPGATNTYSAGRDGAANGGLNINTFTGSDIYTVFPTNMPVGNDSRTISLWVKFTAFRPGITQQTLFGYGDQINGQAFGLSQGDFNNLSDLTFFKWGTDYQGAFTPALNTWYNYIVQYDNNGGANGKIKVIVNGTTIINDVNVGVLNTTGSGFRLGAAAANLRELEGVVDDLTIYNRLLSQGELEVLQGIRQPGDLPNLFQQTLNGITSNSANFSYNLEANNALSTATIRYGTAINGPYPNSVSGTPYTAPIFGARAAQTLTLNGLQPNTTYYYIAEVSNVFGTTTYPRGSFTTTAAGMAPTILTDLAAGDFFVDQISFTQFRVNCKINPNGSNTQIEIFTNDDVLDIVGFNNPSNIITTASLPGANINFAVNNTIMVEGLKTLTNYWVGIKAVNAFGTSTHIFNGANRTLNPYQVLSTPTPNATGITATSATINATVETNGIDGDFSIGYSTDPNLDSDNAPILYTPLKLVNSGVGISPNSSASKAARVASIVASDQITGLNPNTTYYYTVFLTTPSTIGGSGGDQSNIYSFTTLANNPLPLRLLSFEAQQMSNKTQLIWRTAQESNTAGFNIEKSVNGKEFGTIGFVPSENKDKAFYTFNDNQVENAYYRLKMMDIDGSYKYSNIVFTSEESTVAFVGNLYPNPTQNYGNVEINTQEAGNWQIATFGANGLLINTENRYLQKGLNHIKIDKLLKGLNVIRLENGHISETRKIVVE